MGLFENQETGTRSTVATGSRLDDAFDSIANADVSERSVYFDPGVYPLLALDVMKMTESRKGDLFFIAELEILDSSVPSRPTGSRATWMCNFRHDATPGNIRDFISKLNGVSPEEVTKKSIKMACSEKNPCNGMLIRLEATQIETRSGNPFTRHDWRTIPKELQDQSQELRQKAGFGGF